jgi:hypothetical protein
MHWIDGEPRQERRMGLWRGAKTAATARQRRLHRDARVLHAFIGVYCQQHHQPQSDSHCVTAAGWHYCPQCWELLQYALQRDKLCRLDPKPACKDCPVHCYAPDKRQRIRQVMGFAGQHFIRRGRLDWLWHYFF